MCVWLAAEYNMSCVFADRVIAAHSDSTDIRPLIQNMRYGLGHHFKSIAISEAISLPLNYWVKCNSAVRIVFDRIALSVSAATCRDVGIKLLHADVTEITWNLMSYTRRKLPSWTLYIFTRQTFRGEKYLNFPKPENMKSFTLKSAYKN